MCIFWTLHSTDFYSFYVIICRNELYRSCQIHILNNVSGFEHKIKNTKIQFIFIKPGSKMTRFACCFNFFFQNKKHFLKYRSIKTQIIHFCILKHKNDKNRLNIESKICTSVKYTFSRVSVVSMETESNKVKSVKLMYFI